MTQQLQPASRKPDNRRKYDEAFKAEALRLATESRSTRAAARQLGISKKLLYRWQQARTVAEASSTGMARDPEVRALRAANKRLAQEVDILKSLDHLRPADPVSVYQHIATCQPQQPVRRLCQVLGASPLLCLAGPAAGAGARRRNGGGGHLCRPRPGEYEPQGQLLRQCPRRVVMEAAQNGTARRR